MARKERVIYSERDSYVFGDLLLIIAGAIATLGLEDLINYLNWNLSWIIKIIIAFGIVSIVYTFLRKKSDKIKPRLK